MANGFKAQKLSATEESWGWLTVLEAPSTEDDDFYLMLQRKFRFTKDDVRFGHDQPYIEYRGQGWSWYGHILSFELHRDRIRVQMDEEAVTELNNDGLLEIAFELDDDDFKKLENALENTFRGFDYYQREKSA